jgi:hypothetical protein
LIISAWLVAVVVVTRTQVQEMAVAVEQAVLELEQVNL